MFRIRKAQSFKIFRIGNIIRIAALNKELRVLLASLNKLVQLENGELLQRVNEFLRA